MGSQGKTEPVFPLLTCSATFSVSSWISWGSPGAAGVAGAGCVCSACGRTGGGSSRQGRSSVLDVPCPAAEGPVAAVLQGYLGLYSNILRLGKERQQVRRDRKQKRRGDEVPEAEELWGRCGPRSPVLPQSVCAALRPGHSPASGKVGLPGARGKRGYPCRANTPIPPMHCLRGGTACLPLPSTYGAHAVASRQGAGEVVAQDEAVWGDAELPLDGQADAGHVRL